MGNHQTGLGRNSRIFTWLAACFTLFCAFYAADVVIQGRETGAFWTGLAMFPIIGLVWITIKQRLVSPGFERDVYFLGTTLLLVGLYRTGDWFLANYVLLLMMALAWTTLQQLQDEDPQEFG